MACCTCAFALVQRRLERRRVNLEEDLPVGNHAAFGIVAADQVAADLSGDSGIDVTLQCAHPVAVNRHVLLLDGDDLDLRGLGGRGLLLLLAAGDGRCHQGQQKAPRSSLKQIVAHSITRLCAPSAIHPPADGRSWALFWQGAWLCQQPADPRGICSNSHYAEGPTLSSTLSITLSFTYAIGDKGQSDGRSGGQSGRFCVVSHNENCCGICLCLTSTQDDSRDYWRPVSIPELIPARHLRSSSIPRTEEERRENGVIHVRSARGRGGCLAPSRREGLPPRFGGPAGGHRCESGRLCSCGSSPWSLRIHAGCTPVPLHMHKLDNNVI